jgi:hypothetical protein
MDEGGLAETAFHTGGFSFGVVADLVGEWRKPKCVLGATADTPYGLVLVLVEPAAMRAWSYRGVPVSAGAHMTQRREISLSQICPRSCLVWDYIVTTVSCESMQAHYRPED